MNLFTTPHNLRCNKFKKKDLILVSFFHLSSGLRVDSSSTLQSLNNAAKPLRKTSGEILFLLSLVMEMDAQ